MHFSIDFLRTFISLAEERSFSIAAKKLHKSQSSVSSQITLLEDQCGTKLVDRSRRPLRLTQAGVLFLNFAKEVIHRTQQLSASVAELKGEIAGEIKIGAITSMATFLLPSIVQDILEKFKTLRVIISAQNVSQLCEAVRRGEIDLAIVLSDLEPSQLSAHILGVESLCFVVAPSHELARAQRITSKKLRKSPFVVGQESSSYTEMLDRLLKKRGFSEYKVAARISTFEGMKEITRTGIGISILPKYTVDRELRNKTLVAVHVKGLELYANIYLVENARHVETPTLMAVKNLIIDHITARVSRHVRS